MKRAVFEFVPGLFFKVLAGTLPMNSQFFRLCKAQHNRKKWFFAYFESCARNGGRVPDNLDEFMPWNLSKEQKDAWRCPGPFT